MATASEKDTGRDSLKTLCDCPVCFEPYTDPRLLVCGHQFCEKCLKNILDHSPKANIPCPVCREITIPVGGNVKTLARSVLHQNIQEVIFRHPKRDTRNQICMQCKKTDPVKHCTECSSDLAFLCEKCFLMHQKVPRLSKHKVIHFDPQLICSDHPFKMVELFCYDCNNVICIKCFFKNHSEHKIEDMKTAAEKRKSMIKSFKENQQLKLSHTCISRIHHLRQLKENLADTKRDTNKHIQQIKIAIDVLEHQLESAQLLVNETVKKETKKIDQYITTAEHIKTLCDDNMELADNLLKPDVSEIGVLSLSNELTSSALELPGIKVTIPKLNDTLVKLESKIVELGKGKHVTIESKYFDIQGAAKCLKSTLIARGIELKKINDLRMVDNAKGQVWMGDEKKFLVRLDNIGAPVRMYDLDGTLLQRFGKGTKAFDNSDFTKIHYDKKRKLILLPCEDGWFLRIQMNGKIKDNIKFGEALSDVCYLESRDLYALAIIDVGAVVLVSPDSMCICQTISKKGKRQRYQICSGYIEQEEKIVVSEWSRNLLNVYLANGEHIKSLKATEGAIGKQSSLTGISIDTFGGIVVCDSVNYSLRRVTMSKGVTQWQCLLNRDQLEGHSPYGVDIDKTNRYLALSFCTSKIISIYDF